MSTPNKIEVQNVFELTDEDRYDYFMDRVVSHDQLSMVEFPKQDIWMHGELDGKTVLPVWPSKEFSDHFIENNNFSDAQSVVIKLEDWVVNFLKKQSDDDFYWSIFPDMERNGKSPSPSTVLSDVEIEMNNRLFSSPNFAPNKPVSLDDLLKPALRASMKAKPKGKLPK